MRVFPGLWRPTLQWKQTITWSLSTLGSEMVLHNPVLTGMRVFPGFVASNFTNNYMKSVHTWLCARAMQLEYLVGIKHKTDKHCQFLLYLNAIQNCGSSEKLHIFCMQVIHTEADTISLLSGDYFWMVRYNANNVIRSWWLDNTRLKTDWSLQLSSDYFVFYSG